MKIRAYNFVVAIALATLVLTIGGSLFAEEAHEAGTRKVITIQGVPFAFRWCPPGEFLMGSSKESADLYHDSFIPQHRVQLSRGFWLQETELTQAQYEKVTGENPSFWQSAIGSNDPKFARRHTQDNPVERVSWHAAAQYCEELSKLDPAYDYRLVTESEWEYACRAGKPECRYGDILEIAWVFENTDAGNGSIGHMPVAQKAPNDWGLYDMLGNVSEWCSDWAGPPPSKPTEDPTGPQSGEHRVSRGGNCFADAGELRTEGLCLAGTRKKRAPNSSDRTLGFRIVLTAAQAENSDAPSKIETLQNKRIELLKERVSLVETFVKAGRLNHGELVRVRIDLHEVRIEYAKQVAEKKALLTKLLADYDELIQMLELGQSAPPEPNRGDGQFRKLSELLRLKSERIRVQISRDSLE